jgi:hypothetical protein
MCFITIISHPPLAYFSAFCYNDLKLFLNKSPFLPIKTIRVSFRFSPNFHIRLNIYNPFYFLRLAKSSRLGKSVFANT